MRTQQRAQYLLRRGLAGRAGDADDGAAKLAAPFAGERLQGSKRIRGGDDGRHERGLSPFVTALGLRLGDERAPSARLERALCELAAVDVHAWQPYEQVALADCARIHDRA